MSTQLPWFRAYTEMIDDEKLRLLAFEDRWHFMALLCLKGQGVLDDSGPLLMRKVAVKMGLDTRTLEDVVRRLAEVGLVDQDTMQPLNWDTRQMRSDADPTAAERKRKQRAKAKSGAGSKAVTDESRVTCHDVTRTDIDIDTDIDKEEEADKEVVKELAAVSGTQAPSVHADASPSAPPSSTRQISGSGRSLPHRPDDVTEQTWSDWLQLRKAKKAAVTQTVVNVARREAAIAGMALEDFLQVWCARGSQGLMAEWLKPDERTPRTVQRGNQGHKFAAAAATIYEA
ncbi:hypothetical protein [Comamonas odontotermitis]|uniref:hypothetical protein n=1 Tax=Comamonas TaxID=283 RepID=UPI003753C7E4